MEAPAGRRTVGLAWLGALVLVLLLGAASAQAAMPPVGTSFMGEGYAVGGPCVSGTSCSAPPDPIGAVGPNDYVETTNVNGSAGIAVWSKDGTLLSGPKLVNTLWTGYTGTNAGNGCATQNDGDAVVRYDQLADRWIVMQFSLPHFPSSPSFECVAVSKTGDPTGAWWLYDFQYNYGIPDMAKLAVWPDAYYFTANLFDSSSVFQGVDVCAWDRAAMLAGQTATQRCAKTNTTAFAAVPASLEGATPPPSGSPEYLLSLDSGGTSLDYWTASVDWNTTNPLTLSPVGHVTVDAFTKPCGSSPNCIPQPGSTVTLDAQKDWVTDPVVYRNFGDHESLLATHTVSAGAGAGIRWYELRIGASYTPSLFQQGTFAPADGNWRWMPSIGQDAVGNVLVGYSISSNGSGTNAVSFPSIAWAGRLAGDPTGALSQGEAITKAGAGNENDAYTGPPDQHRGRWGDFVAMSVDPSDDCTFWFVDEFYPANGIGNWETWIQNTKFSDCSANRFSVGAAPASLSVTPGDGAQTTVSTTVTTGSAETVALTATGLPDGASAGFAPASVTAGSSSNLTISTSAATPPGTYAITVTGTSAHYTSSATVTLTVGNPPAQTSTTSSAPSTSDTGLSPTIGASLTPALPVVVGAGPPDTILVKHPKPRVKGKGKKTKVTFAFRANQAGATFKCKLDRGKFAACRSPQSYKLKRGKHTFLVEAVAGGGTDPTPTRFKFTITR